MLGKTTNNEFQDWNKMAFNITHNKDWWDRLSKS